MVYVFYFASFVILLREVLRPGVLWFLRNLNDPGNKYTVSTHINLRRSIKIWHFQGGGLFKFDQSGGLIKMEDFNY